MSLITRCGIYCGACYIYRAERDGGEFLTIISQEQNVEPKEIKCNGCLAPEEQKWKNCKKCYPAQCLEKKGYRFCSECASFWGKDCEQYDILADFCAKRGEDVRINLVKIREDPDLWLKEQNRKWKCTSCGAPYSWYEKTCHTCGKSLERTDLNL